MRPYTFTLHTKEVTVCPAASPCRPVIYLNTYATEGEAVIQALRKLDCPDFSLVILSGLDWNRDMSPWAIPLISAHAAPCTGGAGEYLQLLTEEILPAAEEALPGQPLWRGIAGYSLAGLFALWALYQTPVFSRAASMSGSLWFPDFREYALSHPMQRRPDRLYLSLGNKEDKTRNPYMKTVRQNTEALFRFFREQGIPAEFRLHPGGHYQRPAERTAAGIAWLLE